MCAGGGDWKNILDKLGYYIFEKEYGVGGQRRSVGVSGVEF